MNDPQSVVIRLVLAAVLGGAVGLEREIIHRPAGFRTHTLVCVGAALMMLVSTEMFYRYRGLTNVDPGRIAAQVVSGIGFLGAGTILREGASIRGLTTAASLWAMAGVGLAAGMGFYAPAVAGTAIVFLTLTSLNRLEAAVVTHKELRNLRVVTHDQPGALGAVGTTLGRLGVSIRSIRENVRSAEGSVEIHLLLQVPVNLNQNALLTELAATAGVRSVEPGDE